MRYNHIYAFGAGALRCLIAGLLCSPGVTSAKTYSFKNYAQDHGLRNTALNCIAQDRDGFIWAGTQAGLYRYDGDRFHPVGDLASMGSLDIQSMASSSDGSLWIATRAGVVH